MKKLLKVQYMFYLFLVIALGTVLFTMFSFEKGGRTISNSQVAELENWKVTFQDGSTSRITLPNRINAEEKEPVILSRTVTGELRGTTLALHTGNQEVQVRFNGEQLYAFTVSGNAFSKSPGSLWHYVSLPSDFEEGIIEIELQSPFQNLGGVVSEILYGAKSSCILYFMNQEWIGLLCGFALFLFGALFVVYHFAMGHLKLRNTGMFHLGVACILLAFHVIISTGMLQILYGNSSVYYVASYSALYLCVVPFLFYLADTVFENRRKQVHACAWVFTVSFVVAWFLQINKIVDYYQYRIVFLCMLAVAIVYILGLNIDILRKKEYDHTHLVMLLLLVGQGMLFVLDCVLERHPNVYLIHYGLIIMMTVLGLVNISKVVKDYRINLDNRMKENDDRTNRLVREHDRMTEEIEQLRSSKEYADQYSASKSLFLSSVSGKLIVPISNILGVTELVMRDDINDNVKEKLDSIQSAGATALTLTKNLIDYSQYETNTLDLKCVAYPVEKLLYDMSEIVSVGLIEKNVDFIADFSPNLPRELFGDEIRIRQILSTILGNAVRYTQEGSIRFRMDAEISQADEILLNITIADSGAGIKAENLESIFDMFLLYKTDSEGAGTGLGLAVCKKLIDMMEGTISVESKEGEGTTFQIQIPQKIINGMPLVEVAKMEFKTLVYETNLLQKMMLKKAFLDLNLDAEFVSNDSEFIAKLDSGVYHTVLICSSQYEKHQEYLEQPLNASIRKVVMADIDKTINMYEHADILQRPIHCINLYDAISGNDIVEPIVVDNTNHFVAPQAKILVVDDNPSNLKIVTGMLEPYKMDVQTAVSGTACLEILMESMDYDMVFLDYSMPGLGGTETLRTLREYNDKYYKTLPVIAMTVHMVNGAKELFVKEGFDDYIPKPLEQNQLNMILETYLAEEKLIRNEVTAEDRQENADKKQMQYEQTGENV